MRQALDLRKKLLGSEHTDVAESLDNIATLLQKQGKVAEAEETLREALRIKRAALPPDHPDTAFTLCTLAGALLSSGKVGEAEPLAREAVATYEKRVTNHWRMAWSRSLLGACLLGQKKYAEAEPLLRSGFESLNQIRGSLPPEGQTCLVEAGQRLVTLYEAWGRADQAAEWKSKLTEIKQGSRGDPP